MAQAHSLYTVHSCFLEKSIDFSARL